MSLPKKWSGMVYRTRFPLIRPKKREGRGPLAPSYVLPNRQDVSKKTRTDVPARTPTTGQTPAKKQAMKHAKTSKYNRRESDANIAAMDFTCLPPAERFAFNPEAAAKLCAVEAEKLQLQLETGLAFTHPGRYRYALASMLGLHRCEYASPTRQTEWRSYARRVFEMALAQGNAEAHAVQTLVALCLFAERARAKRQARENRQAARERMTARSPEERRAIGQKAATTRRFNSDARKNMTRAITHADRAMTEAQASIEELTAEAQ